MDRTLSTETSIHRIEVAAATTAAATLPTAAVVAVVSKAEADSSLEVEICFTMAVEVRWLSCSVFLFLVFNQIFAEVPHKRFEYKYSFKPPYLAQKDGSVPFWEYGGSKLTFPVLSLEFHANTLSSCYN